MKGYLDSRKKQDCYGCGACYQVCPKNAIIMKTDEEGFKYPFVDEDMCVNCNMCRKVCPVENIVERKLNNQIAWGGYQKDSIIRENSTSGGAFSLIAEKWIEEGGIVFGVIEKEPTQIMHSFSRNLKDIRSFRKSKYLQSDTNKSYEQTKRFLDNNEKVLYSGTPCQIAGLVNYLGNDYSKDNLLTVEVVCEGVPSPIYTQKFIDYLEKKYKKTVKYIDWRNKNNSKWDFEFMKIDFDDKSEYKISRWFNPFWSIWLQHLMSRPSCYVCPFASKDRIADITLGDLWGVHLYCPELYGKNGGSSLVISNTKKGEKIWREVNKNMYGHTLKMEDVLKYQGPMRSHIKYNPQREEFMKDLLLMDYKKLSKKWSNHPTIKLLFSKYVYGNRQKVFLWNIKKKLKLE